MKRSELLKGKFIFYLNALLFLISIGYHEYFDEFLPDILQILFVLTFVVSIVIEYRGLRNKKNKDSFNLYRYRVINTMRLLYGVSVCFLFINTVGKNPLVFNLLIYSYVLYLFSGLRIIKK